MNKTLQKRLDEIEKKITRDYNVGVLAFSDEQINQICEMTASDELYMRWVEFCKLPVPKEYREELDEIMKELEKEIQR